MYKENANIEQRVKAAIAQVVDQWVNDLIKEKIVTPSIDQKYQRGLWDRLKGSLSNLWHGRYNQSNPNYWQNRFGDELGSQSESYDPRVFTLHDFKEIKNAIESTEHLVENIDPNTEKLKIVRVIRAAAEELKKKLFNIFAQSCDGGADSSATPAAESQPPPKPDGAEEKEDNKKEPYNDLTPAGDSPDPSRFDNGGESKESDLDGQELALPEEIYDAVKPIPENENKSLARLESGPKPMRFVDILNHKDLTDEEARDAFKSEKRRNMAKETLDKLLHDAVIKKESPEFIMKVESAIKRMKKIIDELD